MIIEQKDQDVHNIAESNITEFIAFCKFVSLKNTLLNYCYIQQEVRENDYGQWFQILQIVVD